MGVGRQKNRVQGYPLLCSKQEVSLSHMKICLQTQKGGETERESRGWEGKARNPFSLYIPLKKKKKTIGFELHASSFSERVVSCKPTYSHTYLAVQRQQISQLYVRLRQEGA